LSQATAHGRGQKAFLRRPGKKRPYGRLLLLLAFLLICYVYLGGDYGLFKIWSQRREIESLKREIDHLHAEQADLKKECLWLQTDSLYIEKKAREELGLVRDGEKVYQFVPGADSTGEEI
jgi:cell division protein FtsB